MAGSDQVLKRQAEIDIGYDYTFERRWGRFERYVWLCFVLLIILGILGYLGRGPFNMVQKTLGDGTQIEYERVVRFKTPALVSFTLPANNGTAKLEADKTAARKLGLQQAIPQPTRTLGSGEIGPIQFQVADPNTKTVFVQLSMQPSGIGPVTSNYRVNGQTEVQIHQFIVP